jgi:hypothetical protein
MAAMSKSVTLSFGEPEPAPAPARPFNPASMTGDERASARWQVRFVAGVVGLPSLLSIAFVGAVGLWYAWRFTGDAQTWLALSSGLIAVTLFSAGLPIAWGLTRDLNPFAAKAALVFWLACIAMNGAIMTNFARHVPTPGAPAVMRAMPDENGEEIDSRIEGLRDAIEEGTRRVRTPADSRRLASLQAELRGLETQRYGGPMTAAAPAGAGQAPGLDMAALALLMIAGSAVGLLISAGSLAAILTEKAATVRLEAAPAPGPGSIIDVPSGHAGENADGFEQWARACVSKLDGGKVRPAEAHASYLQFAARNDFARPLSLQEFGRRFNAYLAAAYGIDGRHSNGTVFDGIALAPIGHALAVEGR